MGYSYDWSREVITCEPDYYRWNQWFFIQFFKAGLAYKRKSPVNWCPECQTALANEQVVGGACERCGAGVVKRMMEQWYFRITALCRAAAGRPRDDRVAGRYRAHAEELDRQKPGGGIRLAARRACRELRVFTTRPDTVFGVTYMVLAPEHPLVDALTTPAQRAAVDALRAEVSGMSEIDRTSTEAGEERRLHRRLRAEPDERRARAHLDRQLCDDGIRHRRHHGRARARPARLRVRPQICHSHPRGHSAPEGRPGAETHGRGLYRAKG